MRHRLVKIENFLRGNFQYQSICNRLISVAVVNTQRNQITIDVQNNTTKKYLLLLHCEELLPVPFTLGRFPLNFKEASKPIVPHEVFSPIIRIHSLYSRIPVNSAFFNFCHKSIEINIKFGHFGRYAQKQFLYAIIEMSAIICF